MEQKSKRNKLLVGAAIGFVLVGVVCFLYWLQVLRFEESTKDAYVNGNKIELMSQVPGVVSAIYAEETEYVQENQVVLKLDPTDFELALEKSIHHLGETVRQVVQLFLQVKRSEADLIAKDAALQRAQQDYNHRVPLVAIGGVSKEEFEHTEAALHVAQAAHQASVLQLQASTARVEHTEVRTHPLVMNAIDQLKDAWINLKRCEVVAPTSGYITMRRVQIGESIQSGEPLLAIIPLNQVWVDANFKEIKLSKMRIGQPVRVISDMYGKSVVFQGKIMGVQPGTGSVFSLLPPQNATGNWIKIVQRVPVRVSLDPDQLRKYPLWPGLSLDVTVDIHDTTGEMLAGGKCLQPLYETAVYSRQEEGVSKLIEQVIQQNIGSYE